uniref:Uncharacterized protein n=1 Tax=Arundo donax TaxID=35708 RepID=A0A0A9HHC6_ARUDO
MVQSSSVISLGAMHKLIMSTRVKQVI